MKPLAEYFINHIDIRRDAEPHMYLENVRNAVVAAMRSGQCCAMVLRIRLGDHVVRHANEFVAPPLTPRTTADGGSAPSTPRRGRTASNAAAAGIGEMRFNGAHLRDMLTLAPMPDSQGYYMLRSCMMEIIDWIYSNGLTWFLATHNTERSERNVFTKTLIIPSTFALFVHWYPDSFSTATVPNSLHKFWISRIMPVPADAALFTRLHTTILHAMNAGAVHCTLQLFQRNVDFGDCSFGAAQDIICTVPRRLLDMNPLAPHLTCVALYVSHQKHGGLIRWITAEQGLGWFLALSSLDSSWAHLVVTWERVGIPLDDQ